MNTPTEPDPLFAETLQWQFRMSWALARDFHLPRLTDEVCKWSPHPDAITVRLQSDGSWLGDWIEPPAGEPWSVSVAWLTWHLQLWLTQALAELSMSDVPTHTEVFWPGTASGVIHELDRLATNWTGVLQGVADLDLNRPTTFPWPDPRPLHRLLSWVNMEMMKNAAEIGAGVNAALLALRSP